MMVGSLWDHVCYTHVHTRRHGRTAHVQMRTKALTQTQVYACKNVQIYIYFFINKLFDGSTCYDSLATMAT